MIGPIEATATEAVPEIAPNTSLRNLLYAIEWWVFAAFAAFAVAGVLGIILAAMSSIWLVIASSPRRNGQTWTRTPRRTS